MSDINVLEYLSRNDKWYVGGGGALIWAPLHPQWLDRLGFWDGAHYYSYEFQPVFTVALLDEKERVLIPKFRSRKWTPAYLTQTYHVAGRIELAERRAVLPNNSLVSELTLKNNSKVARNVHIVMWTAQPTSSARRDSSSGEDSVSEVACDGRVISFKRMLPFDNPEAYEVGIAMGMSRRVVSHSINASQAVANLPDWEMTPFYEKFGGGKLPDETKGEESPRSGLLYMALHTSLRLNPHARKSVRFATGVSQAVDTSVAKLKETLRARDPIGQSVRNWKEFFSQVPHLDCSDRHFQKYYWYRWYGLRLCAVAGDEGLISFPAVCGGPGHVHVPVSCSAQTQMREMRWMRAAKMAQGGFLNYVRNQGKRGDYPGRLFPHGVSRDELSCEDWGAAVLAVYAVHADDSFVRDAYCSLVRYAHCCDEERDREGSGLYDIGDPQDTDQGSSRRYVAVHERANAQEWGTDVRLKGVDATVHMYRLKKALSVMADRLGKGEESEGWEMASEKIKDSVLQFMWDPSDEIFYDVDPRRMERTRVKAVTSFYPYMTDIVDERHISGLKRHLLNSEEFWTTFPVPTLSCDDPLFNPEGDWKGFRHHCPWNGRVWPTANSRMVEALTHSAHRLDPSLRSRAVELLTKFVHMMFTKDDVRFPNSFEHYSPFSGKPSLYRGVNDCQQSWMVDLIMQYVVGIRPRVDGSVVIDPFPFGMKWVRVDGLPLRGHVLTIEFDEQEISLFVDGVLKASGRRGEKMDVELE